jgi:MFS superfamily sulfate permease-like transporter
MPLLKQAWVKKVPPAVVVLLTAIPLAYFLKLDHEHDYQFLGNAYHVGPKYLVNLPASLLQAIVFPDFSVMWSAVSLKYVVMFSLVGSIESTLSLLAVDSMDPQKRASNLDKDLLAVGVGNLLSAAVGGLPMISEIVRSRANVDAGAQSSKSNFFHGFFLLAFAAAAPGLLHAIPLAALAAMLIFTGTRLASPSEFAHAKHLGVDQLAIFLVTFSLTIGVDLLVGVGVGLLLKIVLHLSRGVPLNAFFKTNLETIRSGDQLTVRLSTVAIFGALLPLRRALTNLDPEVKEVVVDFAALQFVDHTFLNRLHAMSEEWPNAKLVTIGLDGFTASSDHPLASRRKLAA